MAENDNTSKVKVFFTKLTPVQKILLFGVPSIVVIAVIFFIFNSTAKNTEILYSDLDQQESAKIVEYLKENKIGYELLDNGSTIKVDKEKSIETKLNLAKEGIPSSGVLGYELFDRTNLGMSEFVQKLNYRRALEGELSKTINNLDEVKSSRVHLVIPDKALFQKDQKNPTASVTLHLESGRTVSPKSILGIQTLVAKSVEGMSPDEVSVIDHKGKLMSEAPTDINSVSGLTSQQLEQQKRVEDYLSQKVQSMLDNVLGRDNSNIRVNTELDFTKIEQTKKDYDPDRQVVRSEQQINESNVSTDSLSYPTVSMDKQESNNIQNYEISESFEHIIHSVGNIKKLSVAAMINGTSKIVEKDGKKQLVYIPRTEQEIQQLTNIIKNAIGFDDKRNDQISVINVPFDTMIDTQVVEKMNEPQPLVTPENQKLIILLAVILVALFLMYRMLQSKQLKERVRIAMELPQAVDASEEDVFVDDSKLDDLDFDQSELLLLPTELPEQLLLEGDSQQNEIEKYPELMDDITIDKRSLAEKARAKLEEVETQEMTEEALLKLEIKNRVEDFLDGNTENAMKLLRIFMTSGNN